ncbi:peptidyl-prolyl cis-trans isomerase [Candidatus Latescibacterota bacterium]
MLKQMRTNTKWIMIIVIVGFVGMIVLQWGMDIGSRRPGGFTGTVVGSVNGNDINYDLYNQIYESQLDMLGSQQRVTLAQTRMVHEQVWNYIVTNILVEQEIENLDITYSDNELLNYMLNNPVQGADQISIFQENEAFSIVKYQDFIANPQNLNDPNARQYIDMIEVQAKNILPRNKLLESLQNSVIVTDFDVRQQWLIENEKRQIDYLFVSNSGLLNYNADISRDNALAYYEEHKEDYRYEEMRSLEGIFFSLIPTPEDTLEVLGRAELLAERAKSGEDFAELADSYSEDIGNDNMDGTKNGGDLGFFGRNLMTKAFEDVAFALKPGEVSGTFMTQFGYHIVKVDSVKYTEDKSEIDEVKARHILLRIEPSAQTQDNISNGITAFTESVAAGADFVIQARSDSLEVFVTPLFLEEATFIPNVGSSTEMLSKRAFMAKEGEVLPVYMTDDGYYVFRVTEIKKAGIPPFAEVQTRVLDDAERETRKDYAENYNDKLIGHVNGGMSLREAVEAVGDSLVSAEVETANVSRNFNIPGLGVMNKLIAQVFTLENVGDNTGTVEVENGYGVAVLLEKIPLDESMYEDEEGQIRARLTSDMTNSIMSRYMNKLQEDAEIIDDRYLFFPGL